MADARAETSMQENGPHRGRGPQGWKRSDARIQEAVCERLTDDRLIDARGIEVDVEDGVVTLRGEVRGGADPIHVEHLVREVPGVTAVNAEFTLGKAAEGSPPRQPGEDGGLTAPGASGYQVPPT